MVFSSIVFLFYFLPIFLFLYFIVDKKFKNPLILLSSVFFYAWGAPKFIFVLLGTTVIDFYVVRAMYASGKKPLRLALLCLSLGINLGLLFYFKYSNFFIDNFNHILTAAGVKSISWTKLVLPVGISFYTFETLTYVIDVYRGVHKPLKNFWDYQLYIILFPKLIAGPIIRYHDFAGQIYDHTEYETNDMRLRGLYRFFIGLGKKVLIANIMAAAADSIFGIPSNELSTFAAWMGALSYTFQIYFDFSGYSDMAIGLGMFMGFRFPENFNNPYTALSITDFWRKWHITLGNWMRNYLYIPLGGNRKSRLRTYLNLWLVFLASGLWHGAEWGFVIWGAYHGFFLVMERLFLEKYLKKIGKLAVVYSFFVVMIGWVFFRIEYLHSGLRYLSRMFSFHADNYKWYPDLQYWSILYVAIFFSFFAVFKLGQNLQHKVFYEKYSNRKHIIMTGIMVMLCVLSAAKLTTSSFNPFIYFRF